MRLRKNLVTRLVAVAVASGIAVALSGCGGLLVVDNASGLGTCGGNSATIAMTQDAAGENFTVSYTGPSDVSLFVSPSLYSDNAFGGLFAGRVFTIGTADNTGDPDAVIYKLDPSATGWTTSGTDPSTTYSFDGSFTELLNGNSPVISGIFGTLPPVYETITPYTVLVDCDSSDDTQLLVSDSSEDVISSAPTFTAAAPLYPNHVIIDPLVVTNSTPALDGNGITGTLRFSPNTATLLSGFSSDGASVEVFADDPNVPNTDIASLYGQALNSPADADFTFDGPVDVSGENAFTFSSNTDAPLTDGNYILLMGLGNADETVIKVVFAAATYSSTEGLVIRDAFTEPPSAIEPVLATTGMNASSIGLVASGSALLALLGVGVVAATRRRANHR